MNDLLDILNKNPAFADFNYEFREVLTSCATAGSFRAGETIFKTGENADEFYFIQNGLISINVQSPQKGTLRIMTLEDNDVLGWSWIFPP